MGGDLVAAYGRWSLRRVELQEVFYNERSRHIYFLEKMSYVQFLFYNIQLFRERSSEKMCTRESPKGNMGYNQHTVS